MSKLRLISINGPVQPAAGYNGPVALRPETGKNWRIIDAWGWHDDDVAGGVDVTWIYTQYSGGVIAKQNDLTTKYAVNIRVPITSIKADGPSTIIGDLIARHNVYPAFATSSVDMASGHSLKIRALVEEFDGPDD